MSQARSKHVGRTTRPNNRAQRLHKALLFLVLASLFSGYLRPAAISAQGQPPAAQEAAPATPPTSESPAAEPAPALDSSAVGDVTTALAASAQSTPVACAAPDYSIFLPLLQSSGSVPAGGNLPPVTRLCQLALTADISVAAVNLLSVAYDPNGDPLSFSLQTPPANGSASIVGSTLTYTPTNTSAVSDTLVYQANDSKGGSTPGSVAIGLTPANNHQPLAQDGAITVGVTATASLDLASLASDPDGDPLTFSLMTAPANGSASIVGSTLTYTPTAATSAVSDTLAYQVSDGRGGSASATVAIAITQPGNHAPGAADKLVTIGLTETVTLDLNLLAGDLDGDPLTYTIAITPTNGVAALVGSTLSYSPTAAFSQTDSLVYRVSDPAGASAEGTIEFTTRPTRLHITPGSLFMTAQGQPRELSVKAYDAAGDEISTADLDLEWESSNPAEVSIVANGADPSRATVTSLVSSGSAVLVVRSRSNPSIPTALATVMVAGLKPGVVMLPDERAVFPEPNPLPNRPGSPYPLDSNGQPVIGGFTIDELLAYYSVTGTYSVTSGVEAMSFPVVIRGPAPLSGTLVLVSESAPVLGRVSGSIQRGEYTLLRLERASLPEAFSHINLSVNIQELISSGLVDEENFTSTTPDQQLDSLRDGDSPERPNPLAQTCTPTTTMNGIQLNLYQTNMDFDPMLEFDFVIDEASGNLSFWRLITGLKATFSAKSSVSFQAGATLTVSCNIVAPKRWTLPVRGGGWFALINIAIGPRIEVGPKFIAEVKVLGGPKIGLEAGFEASAEVQSGYVWQNGSGQIINVFNKSFTPIFNKNGIDNERELSSAQVEFTAGVYMVGIAKFVAGGLIFDTLEEALGESGATFTWWQKAIYNKIKRALTFEVLNIKVGPELKTVWANSAQVLSDKANISSGALQLVATGSPGDIGSALSLFGLNIPVEIKLFEETMPFWHLYKPLEAGRNEVKPSDVAKKDDTVTFEVYPSGPGMESGEVYYDGEHLADLSLQGGMLRGQWTVNQAICSASESSSDGYVKLDVLGYNKMMNQSGPYGPLPEVLRTANYLGELKISCADLRIKLFITPDPTNRPGGTITACKDKNGKGSLPVSVRAVAEDEAGKMTKVTIDFHGPQEVLNNSSTQKKLELTKSVTLTPDDPTSFSVVGKVVAKGGQGEPDREKEATKTLNVKWVECDGEITEKDSRTRSERCFTITEERSRVGHRKVDKETGAVTVEWEAWSPWQESSRTPTGACTRPIRTGGDPHITTQDGLEFDSFSLGEFTYLKPRPGRDGVTVQARQQRLDRSGNTLFFAWTSWTTGLAFKADGKVVEIRASNLTTPLIDGQPTPLAPGLHSFGELDIKVNSAQVIELSYKGNHFIINQVLDFLELRATVPQDGSLYGMLGTPNGEIADDFRWPDGSLARDAFDLANGWRITDRAESLFTYGPGAGPETYNVVQQNEPPSREELLPFVEQARQLLLGACQADVLDEVAVNNTAMELYTGRAGDELARAGLCWYLVRGTVSNALVEGLAVPGAKVTVSSGQLDTCVTYTDRKGVYSCYMPSLGSIPEVTVAISGRGQGQATAAFTAIPPMNGIVALEQNLAVAPTTLEMAGFVKDGNGTPLYNAELRIKGPGNDAFARAFATAGAYGEYNTYLTVDDGVAGGNATYQVSYNPQWSSEPTALGINVAFERALPPLQPLALNLISETLVLTGNVVKFSGRASYGFNSSYPAPGIRVAITPVEPMAGWAGCDVRTLVLVKVVRNRFEETSDPLKEGTYSCDLPLSQSGAFDVRIQAAGQPAQVIRVDPAGRGLGEVIPVITNIQVTTTVIQLSGLTSDTAGAPVVGTTVTIEGSGSQLLSEKIVVESGPDGRYKAYIGLRSGVASGNLKVTIGYKDIKDVLSVPFSGLLNGQLNLLSQDLTVDGRWVRFSGRVTNSFAPQVPLDGTITISAAGLGTLCSTTLGFSNVYTCTARLALSATALDLSYAVDGSWGSASDSYSLDQLPGLGETRSAPHDVQAQPTTLRLRGTVTSPSGAPLVGATVSAAGPGFAESKTRADGSYDMHMAIPETTGGGELRYTVSFRTSAITATGSFSATPNQVTEVTKNLSYSYRVAYFRGQARNDYNIPMPYSRIVIAAPQLDRICVTQTAADGSYFCAAQTNATAPFSATYVVTGNWGQNSFSELVDVQPGQDRVEHTANLLLNPTALHLVGTLADPAGGPLAGVELTVSGQAVYQEARGSTDASGNYDFYVILKTNGMGQFSDVLTYRVGYGTATILRNVPFTASANALTELYQSFTLNARVIQFTGQIMNQHAPSQPVNGSRVVITSPTLGKLCEYSALNRYSTNVYGCDALLFSDEPFTIEYMIEGGWGTARIGGSIASVPELGQRITVRRDLAVSPTTVRLSGQVVDRDGQPIPGAKVGVTGFGLYNQVAVQSDVNGAYNAYATLESGVTTPTLSYLVEVNNETPLRLEATVVAQPGALTQHSQDFQFTSRKITLSGNVSNLTDPTLPLQGKILIVAPTLGGQLCEASLSDGAYRCTALVRTDEPFELNYRAEGVWGATTAINQIVPGGATAFSKNLSAAPRVLHFTGTVKNPNAAPLANVKVSISSYSIVQGSYVRRESLTDATGTYRSAVILGDGSVGGDLSYLIERNGNTASLQSSFAFSGTTRLLTVTQDLALSSRVIRFEGSLVNTLVNTQGTWSQSRVTISSPTLGKLCEVYATRSYGCDATINTDQPFDVEYRVYGDWGSASATGRMTTLPPVGGQGSLRQDINATPTMLRISGTVTDGSGAPRSGVQVKPASPSPFVSTIWQSSPSDGQGRYELVVILRQVSGTASGTIRLEASYRSTRQFQEAPFSVAEGTLATVSGPGFEFTEREVVLNGRLINTLVPTVPAAQPKGHITITAPNGELFCHTYGTSYSCPIAVYSSDPLEAIITVADTWGGAEQRVLVSTIPGPGGSATVTTNIEVAPTTLHLTGVVADPGGRPLINASLSIKLSSERDLIAGKTDGIGQYDIYRLLKTGTDDGSLSYKITYDGIVSEFVLGHVNVVANELNFRREDFTFEKRRIRFSGKITNQLVAGLPVPARVTITSPDFFTTRYCDAATDASGIYSCDAFVRSSEPFSVTYRVNGGWGQLDVAGEATGIPDVGGSVIVEKNIQVAPTTLRLAGTLTDGYGKKLANADVRIAGTGTIQSVTAKTNANGGYSGYIMLNDNQTSGELNYQLQYYRASLAQTRPYFGLAENQVNDFTQDFEIASRELTFIGRVRHGAIPSLGLSGKVTISSPTIGTICSANTTAEGDYYCPVAAITTEAFSATYTVEGDWGQHAATFPIAFGVVGSTATVAQIVEAQPTILRLTGTLKDQNGAPIPGVQLTVSSPALSSANRALAMTTNAQGEYSLDLLVKAGMLSDMLTYQLAYNQTRGAVQVAFSANAGQINEVIKHIVFTSRIVAFSGKVVNSHTPGLAVPYTQVEISSTSLGTLCTATSDASGDYACSVQVLNNESFAVKYALSGNWGRATLGGSVGSGAVGGTTAVAKSLVVAPTTLRLRGTVTDVNGQPLQNASVGIAGGNLVASGSATTAADGSYDVYVIVREGIAFETLNYTVQYNAATVTNQSPQRFSRGVLTTLNRDFTFAIRRFNFTGRVINALAPSVNLAGYYANSIAISAPGLGQLCNTSSGYYNSSYACSAQINVTSPFSVEHRVSGDWGTQTVTSTISTLPPIGSEASVPRDLLITPTTLRLRGTVRDAQGNPLANARVAVSSNNYIFSAINPFLYATTTVSGTYELYLVLSQNFSASTFNYEVTYSNARQISSRTFSAAPSQLTALDRDFTITERQLQFSGQIRNALAPDVRLVGATRVAVSAPGAGPLCEYSYYYHYSSYSCTGYVTTTSALSVTYALSGDWGTAVYTGTASAGAMGSTSTLNQNLPVSPTTLHLTGKVVDANATPLTNANVQVSGSTFSNGNQTLSASTDASGIYHLYVVLRSGVTSGNVSYQATYNGVIVNSTAPFTATARQLRDLTKDFTVSERRLTFSGQVVNALAPGETVSATRVEVAAGGLGKLCEYAYYYGFTNYSCSAQITTTNALSLTYTISGDWGTSTVFGDAAAAGSGNATTISKNLPVSPTTLHLTGKIALPDLAPLNSVRVVVQSSAFSQNSATSDYTDATGTYHIYPTLKNGVVAGTLDYTVTYNSGVQKASRSFSATASQLTELPVNLTFNSRRINFSGNIVNSLVAWTSYVPSTRVDISALGVGPLCSYTNSGYTFNSYSCTAHITTTSALSVTYQISGAWGSATLFGEVNAGAIGSSTTASRNLAVTPTTIHLTGLALSDGAPLTSAWINLSGSPLVASQSQYTVADGGYEMYLVLRQGVISGTLQFQAQYNSISRNLNLSFNAPAQQLTAMTQNIDLTGQRLTFSGQIVSALAPNQTVTASKVEVSAAGLGKLCEYTYYYAFTYYSCTAQITATNALSLTYTVSGDWGSTSISDSLSGGTNGNGRTISKNLAVTPTTLHLSGTVTKPDGQPLQSAYVYVQGAALSGASNYWAYTDAAGVYHIYPVLKSGQLSGTLTYRVAYNNAELSEARPFVASGGQLTAMTADFNFNVRRVYFYGSIINALTPLTTTAYVPSTSIEVSAAGIGPLCVRTGYTFTNFSCEALITTTNALSLTYTISGAWGSSTVSGSLAAGPVGSYIYAQQNLAVTPPTLRLHGRLLGDGEPLPWASIYLDSPAMIANASAYTSQDGAYELFVPLKSGATTGTLNYQVYYQNIALNQRHDFSAQASGLTDIARDFTLNQRRLQFSGEIRNALVPAYGLSATRVVISDPAYGQLCEWSSSWPSSSYYCTAEITATNPLSLTYTVSGEWGSAVVAGETLEVFPPVGQTASIWRALEITPTMVLLSGTVVDPDGSPLPGASIYVASSELFGNHTLYANADSDGAYAAYGIVKSGAISGSLGYSIQVDNATMDLAPYAVTLNQQQLNQVSRDLTFSARTVRFQGQVTNALVPGTAVYADSIVIASPLLGELCNTASQSSQGFAYDCFVTVSTTAAFTVEYTFSGGWGETRVSAAVAAGAINSETTVTQNVAVSPTTLHVAGTLTLPNGSPLAEATIWIDGAVALRGLETSTSALGEYELYLPIQNVVSGTLDFYVDYGAGSTLSSIPFSATIGAVSALAYDSTFSAREIVFSGHLTNAFIPASALTARAIAVQSPTLGSLCAEDWGYNRYQYQCSAQVLTADPLEVTYLVSGEWGTSVVSGTAVTAIPAVGATTEITADLVLSPTTLRLSGVVRNSQGTPLPNAYVSISGDSLISNGSYALYTDAGGAYEIYAVVRGGVVTGTLDYSYWYNGTWDEMVSGPEQTFAVDQLNVITQDLLYEINQPSELLARRPGPALGRR